MSLSPSLRDVSVRFISYKFRWWAMWKPKNNFLFFYVSVTEIILRLVFLLMQSGTVHPLWNSFYCPALRHSTVSLWTSTLWREPNSTVRTICSVMSPPHRFFCLFFLVCGRRSCFVLVFCWHLPVSKGKVLGKMLLATRGCARFKKIYDDALWCFFLSRIFPHKRGKHKRKHSQ